MYNETYLDIKKFGLPGFLSLVVQFLQLAVEGGQPQLAATQLAGVLAQLCLRLLLQEGSNVFFD